jgi:hypothetical protein
LLILLPKKFYLPLVFASGNRADDFPFATLKVFCLYLPGNKSCSMSIAEFCRFQYPTEVSQNQNQGAIAQSITQISRLIPKNIK